MIKYNKPIVVLFNGPAGVGKTSLAIECAKQSAKGAYTDVDELRNFIKGGKVNARDPNKNLKKFEKQRLLAVDQVACLASNYVKHEYSYFIADFARLKSVIKRYEENFTQFNFYHILLLPKLDEIIRRDSKRSAKQIHGKDIITRMYKEFKAIDYDKWVKLDTTNFSLVESVCKVGELTGYTFH